MKLFFLLIMYLVGIASATGIEYSNMRFIHLQQSEGLIQNSVTAIQQDQFGFIWIGTPNGLYKYDGYTFDAFKQSVSDTSSIISNNIKIIYEDSEGKIWIGTERGLSIYCHNKHSFITPANLKRNTIHSIIEGPAGQYWIGSNNGLYLYRQKTDQPKLEKIITKNPEISSRRGISGTTVSSLSFDKDSNLWIGTDNGVDLLLHDDLLSGQLNNDFIFQHLNEYPAYEALQNKPIAQIITTNIGVQYIGTPTGMYVIKDHLCEEVRIHESGTKRVNTKSLLLQDDNLLWIGTRSQGLIRYNIQTNKITRHKNSPLNPYSIASNQINELFLDANNLLWIGCARGGISKLYLKQKAFDHYFHIPQVNSLSHNQINAICEDGDRNLWVATYERGIDYLTFTNGRVNYSHLHYKIPELKNWQIFSLKVDHTGNLWMGTHGKGLLLIQKDELAKFKRGLTPKIVIFDSFKQDGKTIPLYTISNINQVGPTEFWLNSFVGEGITQMTLPEGKVDNPIFKRYSTDAFNQSTICSNYVSITFVDDNNHIWVGSRDNGLSKLVMNTNQQVENYIHIKSDPQNSSSLSNDRIFAIEQDNTGRLWIGTFGGGINILKKGSSAANPEFIHIDESSGLADNSIYSILKDKEGNFWVSTDVGISKIDAATLEIRNFNVSDGIQKGNFRRNAAHKGFSNKFYFGGISGITAFYPENIQKDTTPPRVLITNLAIQGKRIHPNTSHNGRIVLQQSLQKTKKIELRPSERSFSFELASTQYAFPEYNIFQYKLEGFNDQWQEVDQGTKKIAFSNLRHGRYTLRVKTITPGGITSTNEARLAIRIRPPLYLTPYAFAFYVLVVVLIFGGFRKIIIFRQQLNNELKIEQLEKEKMKEINQMKLTFFTNISHEFKTPLTLILGPLEAILSSGKLDRFLKDNLKTIQSNANRMLKLVDQLMEFRKIETGHLTLKLVRADIVFFLKEISHSFNTLAKKHNLELNFTSSSQYLPLEFDPDKLEKIVYNLLSNAIKHSPEGGFIKVDVSKEKHRKLATQTNDVYIVDNDLDNCVTIKITDTGNGIPPSEIEKVFDRFYRSENREAKIQSSTGIGLSMVKSLVALHKGILIVNSKQNAGSTFIVKLPGLSKEEETLATKNLRQQSPRLVLDEEGATKPQKPLELPQFFSHFSSGKRPLMLLVDDNEEIRQFLSQAFEKHFEILEASNGKEALEISISQLPEIIISDVMMPEMDGYELTHAIKENTLTNHIPIILLTAKGALEHRIEGIRKGADSYIPKPFKLEHLATRIQQLIELRNTLREKYLSENSLKRSSKSQSYSPAEMVFLQNAEKAIEKHLTNTEFAVADLESELSLSRMQLYRKLKSLVNLSANEFIRDYRLRRAAILLSEGEHNISEIIYKTGFSNHSYFTRCFKKKYGKSPKEFVKDFN